ADWKAKTCAGLSARQAPVRQRRGFFCLCRMHPDLERLIALQRLDTTAESARRTLADEPERERAFEGRLETARQQVAAAKTRLTDNQNARRAVEKDVAVHQGRLSKFRDQAMEV